MGTCIGGRGHVVADADVDSVKEPASRHGRPPDRVNSPDRGI